MKETRERQEKLQREPGKELSQHTPKRWKPGCKKKLGVVLIQMLDEQDLEHRKCTLLDLLGVQRN